MAKVQFFEDPEFFRKQTFFLLGAMACALSLLFVPLFALRADVEVVSQTKAFNQIAVITAQKIEQVSAGMNASNTWTNLSYLSALLTAGGCLGVIFLYKKRKNQASAARLVAFLFPATGALSFLAGKDFADSIPGLKVAVGYEWGLIFVLIGLGLAFYAAHAAMQDEKKIRAASRLW